MIAIHSRECSELSCFCRHTKADKSNSLINDGEYLVRLIENKLNCIRQKFHNSIMVTLIFVTYRLEFLKAYTKSLHHITQTTLKTVKKTWVDEFLVFQLKSKVKSEVLRDNIGQQLHIERFFEG